MVAFFIALLLLFTVPAHALVTFSGKGTVSGNVVVGAPASTGTPPNSIANLTQWSVPENQGLSNGASVATVLDYSGNSNTLTPVSTQAVFNSSGINGQGTFTFNGTSDQYSSSAFNSAFTGTATPYTWFGVIQHLDQVGSQCYMMFANITGGDAIRPTLDVCSRPTSGTYFTARATTAWESVTQGGNLDLNPHALIVIFDGTTVFFYVDNVLIAARTGSWSAITMTSGAYTLGDHRRSGVNDGYFHGKFGETGVYSRAINDTERTGLDLYLRTKYGISTGSNPWSPNQLFLATTTSGAWYRDDSFVGVTDGTVVTSWGTRASESWNYATTPTYNLDYTSGPGCTYHTSIQNSKAACQFNGTTQYLGSNTSLGSFFDGASKPFTVWFVAKQSVYNGQALFWLGQPSSSAVYLLAYFPATPTYSGIRRDTGNHSISPAGNTPDTATHLVEYSYDGTNMSMYVDGAVLSSWNAISFTTTTNGGDNNLGTLSLASLGAAEGTSSNPSNFATGYVMEQGILGRVLTSGERTQLVTYSQAYWGTP